MENCGVKGLADERKGEVIKAVVVLKPEFKGKIKDIEGIDFSRDATHTVKVKGDLTMHGKTEEVETTGKLVIQGGKINAMADFTVKLSDFNISIPGLVADKVSKSARISVSCSLEPLKN